MHRRYGGVDPQERQRQRRERLIAAGVELFGTRGYHSTTVKDLCKQAGLTERYFYESFKNLSEAFFAIYRGVNEDFKQALLSSVMANVGKPPMELARAVVQAELAHFRKDARVAHLMLVEAPNLRHLSTQPAEVVADYGQFMSSIVLMLYPEAPAMGYNVSLIASGLVGLNLHTLTEWVRSGYRHSEDDVIGTIMLAFESMHLRFLALRDQHLQQQAQRKSAK